MFLNKILKNKKGQGTLEFGGCVLTFLLLTLGMFDICKFGITYMDTNSVLSENVALMVSASEHKDKIVSTYKSKIVKELKEKSFFCTIVDGQARQKCQSDSEAMANAVNVHSIGFGVKVANGVNASQGLPAGSLVCVTTYSKYSPLFKKMLGNRDVSYNNTVCSIMEYSGASPSGFMRID